MLVPREHTGPGVARGPVQPVRGDVPDQPDHPRPRVRADHPVAVLLLDEGDLAEQHPDGVLEGDPAERLVGGVQQRDR